MSDPQLLRLLGLVQRELSAVDARIEIGGQPPSDERTMYCEITGGARLVVVLEAPPEDRARAQERLAQLARSFSASAEQAISDLSASSGELVTRRLDDELAALADRAGAVRAVVIDAQSPVVWGTSEIRRGDENVESALRAADALAAAEKAGVDLAEVLTRDSDEALTWLDARGVEPPVANFLTREAELIRQASRRGGAAWRQHLATARAIACVRRDSDRAVMVQHKDFGYLSRAFANIYRLILVFDAPYSELHAEGAVVHALPVIERLVLGLPPVEPPPKGGRVIRLPPR